MQESSTKANDPFGDSVVQALEYLLHDKAELVRLNLSPDIVGGWRDKLNTLPRKEMIETAHKVATDNGVAWAEYAAKDQPLVLAEMILYAVDGFYRKMLTKPN